jgi:acid phosphatase (class A)
VLGWIWASILSDLAPDRSDALIARGIAFGESRAICGFHYESDVTAGRLAAAALMAREEADPGFRLALDNARAEFRTFIARHPVPASVPSGQRNR